MPFVTGIDEAGLGAIAGPLTVAAVTLEVPTTRLDLLREWWPIKEVRDSKELAEYERNRALRLLLQYVSDHGGHIALGDADVELFNKYGHINSLTFALNEVSDNICLGPLPSLVVLDGVETLPPGPLDGVEQVAVPKADRDYFVVAAASIVAKTTRDHYMQALGRECPEYLFEKHKGYGTAKHIEMLRAHKIGPHHRVKACQTALGLREKGHARRERLT
jgi:ribonuclease HII